MTDKEMEARRKNIAKIKGLIATNELTAAAIEQRYKLYKGCVYDTMREPNETGEAAIAEALGVKASTLWAERYEEQTGQRLSPQPHSNYYRPPSRKSSQKLQEA